MAFKLITGIDGLNRRLGRGVAWLVLAMVLVQFGVVVLRHVFSIGFVAMQESVLYLHGTLFMLGAGYTLLNDGHVRVDVFYRDAKPRTKAIVDLAGALLFLLPVCVLIVWYSWDYVLGAWSVAEGSREGSGLPLTFLYKTVIWVFAASLGLQGCSMALKCWAFLSGAAPDYPVKAAIAQDLGRHGGV